MRTLDTNINNKRSTNNINDKTQEESHKKQKTNKNVTTNIINNNSQEQQQRFPSLAFDVREVKKFDLKQDLQMPKTSQGGGSIEKFGSGDLCDICNKHDGFKDMNMQKCKSCGIFVHENCYGLEHKKFGLGNVFKYPVWECHACAAVGKTVTIKNQRKNDASTIIHIKERPMNCALCTVKSQTAAMHPIYDKHGANGQHIMENNELQWVHTICANVVNKLANSNFVYGCDEVGNYEDVDDEDTEDETNRENPESQSPFEVWPHHFVITSKLDGASVEVMKQLTEFRNLKCIICSQSDKQNSKRIVVQCSYDEYCTTAYHVGCAKWNPWRDHQLIELDPSTQCCKFLCRDHSNKKKSLQCHPTNEMHAEAKQIDMKPKGEKYQKSREFELQIYRNMKSDLIDAIRKSKTWKEYDKNKDSRKDYYRRLEGLTSMQFNKLWTQSTDDVLTEAMSKFDGTDEGDCDISSISVAKPSTKKNTASEQSKRITSLYSNLKRKEKEMRTRNPSSANKASCNNNRKEATENSLSHPETPPQLTAESRSDNKAIGPKGPKIPNITRQQQKQITRKVITTMGLGDEI